MAVNDYYGVNMNASDYGSLLAQHQRDSEGRMLWDQIIGNASLQHANASNVLQGQYSSAVASAYEASLASQNVVRGSNLGQGYKDVYETALRQSLVGQVNELAGQRMQAQDQINNQHAKNMSVINNELMRNAENFTTYSDALIDYAAYLQNVDGFTGPVADRFRELFTEDGLNEQEAKRLAFLRGLKKPSDSEKAELQSLQMREGLRDLSPEEIRTAMFEMGENGYQLSRKGIEMLDMLQNADTPFGVFGFGEWAFKGTKEGGGGLGDEFNNWLRGATFSPEFEDFLFNMGISNQSDLSANQLFNFFTGRDINDDTYGILEHLGNRDLTKLTASIKIPSFTDDQSTYTKKLLGFIPTGSAYNTTTKQSEAASSARALASQSTNDFKKQLNDTIGKAGTDVLWANYGAGIDAQVKLIEGLGSDTDKIKSEMLKLEKLFEEFIKNVNSYGDKNNQALESIARGSQNFNYNSKVGGGMNMSNMLASDEKWKTDIKPVSVAELQKFMDNLKVYSYKHDYYDGMEMIGVMAQDVAKQTINGVNLSTDTSEGKMIRPNEIMFALLGYVKHLEERLKKLE